MLDLEIHRGNAMKSQAPALVTTALLLVWALKPEIAGAQQSAPSLIITNGKIVTVDERFLIAEAVAIRGERILRVGTSSEIGAMAAQDTRLIDVDGRTVIPGLIDNHMHLLRAGTTWQREVRWDGVDARARALDLLRDRAGTVGPGDWILVLGGWTLDQFSDDSKPFTRAELDDVVPNHPVLLQASYYESFLNSAALNELGISSAGPNEAWIVRDRRGRPTGRIEEAGIRGLVAALPPPTRPEVENGTLAMIRDLNRAGVTAVGSAGCPSDLVEMYKDWASEDRLNMRVFCIDGPRADSPDEVDRVLPTIPEVSVSQGDNYVDHVTLGEGLYGPLHDPMFVARSRPASADLAQWYRLAKEVARSGFPLHVHANFRDTISAFLDQIELVHRDFPVRNLRWVFAHVNQLEPSHLQRMKALGMYAAVHPWAVVNGGINARVFGAEALGMAPLRTIQDSGITWGFGSDGSRANQVRPFMTLAWAVTGEMVGGTRVLDQTISREEALIAHTRKNAYFVFREDEIGSIQAGKLADLVVLDRDYVTIPDDQIKDIVSVMTVVGGRIAYEIGL